MIIGWIRLAVFGFIAMTIAYFLVSIYSRSVRREKLEKRFDAGGIEGDRDAYIEEGMAEYEGGLRKRLIWLVYVIPTLAVVVILYVLNFQ